MGTLAPARLSRPVGRNGLNRRPRLTKHCVSARDGAPSSFAVAPFFLRPDELPLTPRTRCDFLTLGADIVSFATVQGKILGSSPSDTRDSTLVRTYSLSPRNSSSPPTHGTSRLRDESPAVIPAEARPIAVSPRGRPSKTIAPDPRWIYASDSDRVAHRCCGLGRHLAILHVHPNTQYPSTPCSPNRPIRDAGTMDAACRRKTGD